MNSVRSRLERRLERLCASARPVPPTARRASRIDLVYLSAEEHERLQRLLD